MLATVVLELFQLLPSSVAATCGERHERKVWRSFDTQQLDNLQDEVSRQKVLDCIQDITISNRMKVEELGFSSLYSE